MKQTPFQLWQKRLFSTFKATAFLGGSLLVFDTFAQPAQAGVAEDIAVVTDTANLLAGIVTVMVQVVVAPLGISAAAKTFRHVIIANV